MIDIVFNRRWRRVLLLGFVGVCLLVPGLSRAGAAPGTVTVKGSNTMVKVARIWARTFAAVREGAMVEVKGGGTGNGMAALINGHVDIVNASRPIKSKESRLAATTQGREPVGVIVGGDVVGVIVHPDNPLARISLAGLAGIYGQKGRVRQWSDLGVQVPGCADQRIRAVTRRNNSGTYAFFRNRIFSRPERFRRDVTMVSDPLAVVKAVAADPCAISYLGMAEADKSVKTLCVGGSGACGHASLDAPAIRAYPLIRPLYVYTIGSPDGLVKEYIEWVLGPAGQAKLKEHGYLPAQ